MITLCTTCKYFHPGLRIEITEIYPTLIGECDNANVPNRLCVSYGTICGGVFYELKKEEEENESSLHKS